MADIMLNFFSLRGVRKIGKRYSEKYRKVNFSSHRRQLEKGDGTAGGAMSEAHWLQNPDMALQLLFLAT